MKETKEETNAKIFHVDGLEELVSFKYSYYPTDSMQTLSKFHWHFL